MGSSTKQIRNKIKALAQEDQEALDSFIAKLPVMVEERREVKTKMGSEIIQELKAKGKHEEAAKHDPEKEYRRLYVTLVEMDHKANAHKAFAKKGIKGLQQYERMVIDQAYRMKGKYPHLFPAGTGTKKPGFWQRLKDMIKRTPKKAKL